MLFDGKHVQLGSWVFLFNLNYLVFDIYSLFFPSKNHDLEVMLYSNFIVTSKFMISNSVIIFFSLCIVSLFGIFLTFLRQKLVFGWLSPSVFMVILHNQKVSSTSSVYQSSKEIKYFLFFWPFYLFIRVFFLGL